MSSGAATVAALGLACAGSSVPVIDLPPPAASDLVTAEGCEVDSPTGLTKQIHVADGRGRPRQFDLFATPGYDRHRPVPLVFLFHGTVSDSISGALRDELARHGDQAIIVTPQGMPFDVYGVGWNQACNGYDMPFYDAMVRAVSRRYCVDPHRIFASGFSWGADMVDALACCRGDTLRGIAPFSGDETSYNVACTSRSYPAVRQRYGSAQGEAGDGAYTRSQFRAATEFFRRAQSCAVESDPAEPSPCRSFRGCRQPVLECEYPNMAHAGPDASEIAATWRFWRSLPQ